MSSSKIQTGIRRNQWKEPITFHQGSFIILSEWFIMVRVVISDDDPGTLTDPWNYILGSRDSFNCESVFLIHLKESLTKNDSLAVNSSLIRIYHLKSNSSIFLCNTVTECFLEPSKVWEGRTETLTIQRESFLEIVVCWTVEGTIEQHAAFFTHVKLFFFITLFRKEENSEYFWDWSTTWIHIMLIKWYCGIADESVNRWCKYLI